MRDGVRLHTCVYIPKKPGKHPILLERTPYSAGPYGAGRFSGEVPTSGKFVDAGYAFAFQDVRGRFMSEGKFVEVRPQLQFKVRSQDIDESTDAYDTIDYLVKNVPQNNGRVGVWGISYPGFYASCAAVNAHPALKVVSPQAPVTEWFIGDDVHHNGAFFLHDNFSFYFWFGYDKDGPAEEHPQIEPPERITDAYRFFLNLGPLTEIDRRYYKGRYPFWNEIFAHPDMDDFWQSRAVAWKLTQIKCPVLVVGGWYDAEDLFGTLHTFRRIQQQNPGVTNHLVMGPWQHGGWFWGSGRRFGPLDFGSDVSSTYREDLEFPFLDAYLRGNGKHTLPKATMFETGTNRWRQFGAWPPQGLKPLVVYLDAERRLNLSGKPQSGGEDRYVSDPANPTPYVDRRISTRPATYMVEDQAWAGQRADVLEYRSEPLTKPRTVAGPVVADLYFSSTGTDADLVVKVLDIYPDRGPMANQAIPVRMEVFRAKYRESFQNPSPLRPQQVERLKFALPDVLHTFRPGHRIGVQIQSSWFPLVDRNPNRFMNIYLAKTDDFQPATITIHRSAGQPSSIRMGEILAPETKP